MTHAYQAYVKSGARTLNSALSYQDGECGGYWRLCSMKIILIQPPIRDFYRTHQRTEPLGLEYIASSLLSAGYEVKILDALASDRSEEIPIPPELAHIKPHYLRGDLSPFSLFSTFRHFGMRFEELAERCAEFAPDLIGISANFTPYVNESLECARWVKERCPRSPVVLGGHHATIRARELSMHPAVDFVVCGEGEQIMCDLARVIAAGTDPSSVRGLVFRRRPGDTSGDLSRNFSDDIIETPPASPVEPLDDLPWPLPYPALCGKGILPETNTSSFRMMLTSRGCPRKCGFCSIEHVMGPRLRLRDLDHVLAEITAAVEAGARFIDFEDDNMNWDPVRMLNLMRELQKRFSGRGIRFSAMNGLVAERLTPEIMTAMREAGFDWLNLPVVSGNPDAQTRMGRRQPVELFEETVRAARAADLGVTAYLILGLPTDTLENMIRDVMWLARLPVQLGPSVFYPVPGTPLYDLCVNRGYITDKATLVLRSSAYPVETGHFSRVDLVTLMRLCRLINYVKGLQQPLEVGEKYKLSPLDGVASGKDGLLILSSPNRLGRETIGAHLVHRFLEDGKLLGIITRRKKPFVYEEVGLNVSEKVMEPIRDFLRRELSWLVMSKEKEGGNS